MKPAHYQDTVNVSDESVCMSCPYKPAHAKMSITEEIRCTLCRLARKLEHDLKVKSAHQNGYE